MKSRAVKVLFLQRVLPFQTVWLSFTQCRDTCSTTPSVNIICNTLMRGHPPSVKQLLLLNLHRKVRDTEQKQDLLNSLTCLNLWQCLRMLQIYKLPICLIFLHRLRIIKLLQLNLLKFKRKWLKSLQTVQRKFVTKWLILRKIIC